jgi:uncharacterized protein (TIGR03435 family)
MKRVRIYFFRAFCATCGIAITLLPGAGVRAGAQTTSTDLSFEVATIKPVVMDASHPFDPRHFWAHVSPGRASYWSMTLKSLVTYAYGVQQFQVSGPGLMDTDRYDIEAKLPDGATKDDDKKMLQALLKERFKLAFHIERRELEGYALVVGKHGAKLKPSLPDPPNSEAEAPLKSGDGSVVEGASKSKVTTNPDGSSTVDMGKRGTQTVKFDQENWTTHYELSKMTMEQLAGRLGGCVGRDEQKVEDQTGIKGNYQVAFDCPMRTPKPAIGGDATDPQGVSSLAESLDALGLRLEKRKTLLDVYVIDHVEKPSEN